MPTSSNSSTARSRSSAQRTRSASSATSSTSRRSTRSGSGVGAGGWREADLTICNHDRNLQIASQASELQIREIVREMDRRIAVVEPEDPPKARACHAPVFATSTRSLGPHVIAAKGDAMFGVCRVIHTVVPPRGRRAGGGGTIMRYQRIAEPRFAVETTADGEQIRIRARRRLFAMLFLPFWLA